MMWSSTTDINNDYDDIDNYNIKDEDNEDDNDDSNERSIVVEEQPRPANHDHCVQVPNTTWVFFENVKTRNALLKDILFSSK